MVSNEDIKQQLGNKREGKGKNGYLVCDTCLGSYELQPGEKPDDFSSVCECDGELKYKTIQNDGKSNSKIYENKNPKLTFKIILFVIFSIVIASLVPIAGPLVLIFTIWWIFFHKNVDILSSENKKAFSKSKNGIIKNLIYVILLIIMTLFYLSQVATLFKNPIYVNIITFGGLVVLFLVVRYLLNRFIT